MCVSRVHVLIAECVSVWCGVCASVPRCVDCLYVKVSRSEVVDGILVTFLLDGLSALSPG